MPRHWAEGVARAYLETLGYQVVAENYHVRGGEIDLVAQDGATLVFVEVKQRRTDRYGSPAEAIGPTKIGRLQQTALSYLSEVYGRDDLPVRFDAVLIHGTQARHRLTHLKAVF